MQNAVILIDPFQRRCELVALQPGRGIMAQIRDLVGAPFVVSVKPAPAVVLWVDHFGMLKGKDQRFWRIASSNAPPFSGRTVATGVDEDGMPTAVPENITAADFEAGLDWCEGVSIKRVRQDLRVEHHPTLGPWPITEMVVEWEAEEQVVPDPPAAAKSPSAANSGASSRYWMIFEDGDADFLAKERAISGDEGEEGVFTGREERFETLEEVKAFGEREGLHFILREPGDPEGIAGTLI
jgi:hypothetical protein